MNKDAVTISIQTLEDCVSSSIAAKKKAEEVGFDITNQTLIATVVSELATNIVRYAVEGVITIKPKQKSADFGIEIIAEDNGPGIEDVEKAMQESYTTTKNSLGLGLPSIKRIMDEHKIISASGKGTLITAVKWRN